MPCHPAIGDRVAIPWVGYARHVARIPDGLTPVGAAPLTCAGAMTHRAVQAAGVRPAVLDEPAPQARLRFNAHGDPMTQRRR
jgi:hypothetical protein